MTQLSLVLPEIGKPDATEDVKIDTALTTIQNWANGNVDSGNFPKALSTTTIGASYSAPVKISLATKYKAPVASRPAMVQISVACGPDAGIEIRTAAGVIALLGNHTLAGAITLSTCFLLGALEEWEAINGGFPASPAQPLVAYRAL